MWSWQMEERNEQTNKEVLTEVLGNETEMNPETF